MDPARPAGRLAEPRTDRVAQSPARRARLAAGGALVALLALYAATLAPGVTLWDAGELVAAIHGLGIPHPPGTPLFVLAGHAWAALLFAVVGAGTALAANLLSALCTAAAGAVLAALVARWTGSVVTGLAAALCAGTASSVWMNATEAEVYALALLHAAAMLWCADRRARAAVAGGSSIDGARWSLLLAYLFALAPALHLSALVAAPAAIVRATWRDDGELRVGEALALAAALLLAAAVGTGSTVALAGGTVALVTALALSGRSEGGGAAIARWVVPLALLGASALAVMYVRARFDPGINQGNPATPGALLDVVWRRQYEAVGLLPRRAPLWLQLGNLFEYADWQWALGLDGGVAPGWRRTPVTLLYALLGLDGAMAHRRVHRASWRALAVLLASASVGVVLYLNLKAGPSYGGGFIADDAVREARERDYFFALAFWTWGAWAGMGAVALARRGGHPRLGLLLAALPAVLNWRATDRSAEPEASLARVLADAMLRSAPPGAVLLSIGDNDSYPLWYLQQVEGVRRDVVLVTVPLLGAPWYRAELARRWALLEPGAVAVWRGEAATARAVARNARAQGRPVAVTLAMPTPARALAGEPGWEWSPRGMVYVARGARGGPGAWAAGDSATTAAVAARLAPYLARQPRVSPDGAVRAMFALLRCPALAVAAPAPQGGPEGERVLLDSSCNLR